MTVEVSAPPTVVISAAPQVVVSDSGKIVEVTAPATIAVIQPEEIIIDVSSAVLSTGGAETDPLSIHIDGTSTTTAQIPFAYGLSASYPNNLIVTTDPAGPLLSNPTGTQYGLQVHEGHRTGYDNGSANSLNYIGLENYGKIVTEIASGTTVAAPGWTGLYTYLEPFCVNTSRITGGSSITGHYINVRSQFGIGSEANSVTTGLQIAVRSNHVFDSIYALKIDEVNGGNFGTDRWAIYDASTADWWLKGNTKRIYFGASKQAAIYFDGTNAQFTSTGGIALNTLTTGGVVKSTAATGVIANASVSDILSGLGLTISQGDLIYGSAASTVATLTKNTTATRYLSNTGSSNNPAWAQVNLSNGVTGTLASSSVGAAGSNTYVQYNNSGVLGAEAAFTYDASTDTLAVVNQALTGTSSYTTTTSAIEVVSPITGDSTSLKLSRTGSAMPFPFTWNVTIGKPGSYDAYLKIWRSRDPVTGTVRTENDFDFALAQDGTPLIFNHNLGLSDNYTFGSYSVGALAYYLPYSGGAAPRAQLWFTTESGSPYRGTFEFGGYSYNGGLHNVNFWTASHQTTTLPAYIAYFVPQTLAAGTTTTNTAPLKWVSGPLNTSPSAGSQEFLTDKWYGVITTGTARKEFALVDASGGLTSGRFPYVTTNGRLTDSARGFFDGTNFILGNGSSTATFTLDMKGGVGTSAFRLINDKGDTDILAIKERGGLYYNNWSNSAAFTIQNNDNSASSTSAQVLTLIGASGQSGDYFHIYDVGFNDLASINSSGYLAVRRETITDTGNSNSTPWIVKNDSFTSASYTLKGLQISLNTVGRPTLDGLTVGGSTRTGLEFRGPSSGTGMDLFFNTASTTWYNNSAIGMLGNVFAATVPMMNMTTADVAEFGPNYDANSGGWRTFPVKFYYGENLSDATIDGGYFSWVRKDNGGTETEVGRWTGTGRFGVRTSAPDRAVEINDASGNTLRLTYNDSNGSAANYTDLLVTSGGNLTITPSGGTINADGYIAPKSSTDAAAPNNSIYYSTTQSKLVYKDSGGVSNALY
jgi:hypothetical protein